ncbi:MAG: hypothetical protein K8R46_04875 [Pirellulales bacterium]|nr:hypothetical protein [Pirellulales bacterium]
MNQCAKCGFLVVRNKATGELVSPTDEYRDFARIMGTSHNPDALSFNPTPICSVGARVLWSFPQDATLGDAVGILTQGHDCQKFVDWIPALSPKEHIDILNTQADHLWQERQSERDRKWRKEDNRNMALW